jgi:ribonuclease HI
MMTMSIPKGCLHEIEKIQRSFIWGDREDKRRAHLVGWETITQPKESGGLGLRNLTLFNEACLMKMGWSLMIGENSLWGQVLVGKYGRGEWNQGRISTTPNDSSLWKAIAKSWPKLEQHRCWAVGDGHKVSLWDDVWLNENQRLSDFDIVIPTNARNWKLKDIVDDRGNWRFDMINNIVPVNIIHRLYAIVPPNTDNGIDMLVWPGNRMGEFTVSSAYDMLAKNQMDGNTTRWRRIWKLGVIERIRVFVWQISHDRLLTKQKLARWQLGNAYCDNCHFDETIIHALRDCPIVVHVWNHLISNKHRGNFYLTNLQEWIDLNLQQQIGNYSERDWSETWATTCYLLWTWRNKRQHDENFVSPSKPWLTISEYVNTYTSMRAAEASVEIRTEEYNDISWKRPLHGWIALNTDGAAKQDSSRAGCGGVLRDEDGRWIQGFSKNLGSTTAYIAELWGIYEGLCMAKRRNIRKVELLTDSMVIAQNLKTGSYGSYRGHILMKKIRALLQEEWEVKISHVFREANRCADILANMGSVGSTELVLYDYPPSEVALIAFDDLRGVSLPRLISV